MFLPLTNEWRAQQPCKLYCENELVYKIMGLKLDHYLDNNMNNCAKTVKKKLTQYDMSCYF